MKRLLNLLVVALLLMAVASCKKDDPKPAPGKDDPKTPPTEKVEVTSVTLNKTTLTLTVDNKETLTATIAPENATDKTITWSSSDKAVATVDKTGAVTAVAAGEATITATSSNGKTATCTVTVIVPAGFSKTIEGIDCVYIPAGTFLMGSPETEPLRQSYENQHSVTLAKGFWMSAYEITNAQFCAFLNANNSSFDVVPHIDNHYYELSMNTQDYGEQLIAIPDAVEGLDFDNVTNKWKVIDNKEDKPVCYISWYGANEYAKWIGGVLPTEAQWEYACRGGQKESLPFGVGNGTKLVEGMAKFKTEGPYDLAREGEYVDSSVVWDGLPEEVGSYAPNGWGLYDMHGNMYEWCFDWYDENYYSDNQIDPIGPSSGEFKVFRGGSCQSNAVTCRSACRSYGLPNAVANFLGFRIIFPE